MATRSGPAAASEGGGPDGGGSSSPTSSGGVGVARSSPAAAALEGKGPDCGASSSPSLRRRGAPPLPPFGDAIWHRRWPAWRRIHRPRPSRPQIWRASVASGRRRRIAAI
ncbi:hypothetical protein ACP4OV_018601 [Aristida adscensionis]